MARARPDNVFEIFLQPGDHYFGDEATRIRTVLGSCVSVVLWHPRERIGGMCHYMLPSRPRARGHGERPDGRYGDEAIELLLADIERSGTRPRDYQAKIIGGGNMFPGSPAGTANLIGRRNVEAARRLVCAHGFVHVKGHLEGDGHRNVIFDVWSGDVWVRHRVAAVAPP